MHDRKLQGWSSVCTLRKAGVPLLAFLLSSLLRFLFLAWEATMCGGKPKSASCTTGKDRPHFCAHCNAVEIDQFINYFCVLGANRQSNYTVYIQNNLIVFGYSLGDDVDTWHSTMGTCCVSQDVVIHTPCYRGSQQSTTNATYGIDVRHKPILLTVVQT